MITGFFRYLSRQRCSFQISFPGRRAKRKVRSSVSSEYLACGCDGGHVRLQELPSAVPPLAGGEGRDREKFLRVAPLDQPTWKGLFSVV